MVDFKMLNEKLWDRVCWVVCVVVKLFSVIRVEDDEVFD